MRGYWLFPLFAMSLAGPEARAQEYLRESTLYRLDAGSSFQRGCLDPAYCDVPAPVPLSGTFVLTPTQKDFDLDAYEMSEVHWQDGSGGGLLLLGGGSYWVRSPFSVFRVIMAHLGGTVPEARFEGRADGAGTFSRLDITMSASLGPYDDARIVLIASPVPDTEIRWFRVHASSTYKRGVCNSASVDSRALTGTFGLLELHPGLADLEVVSVRWRALSRDSTDPSDLFLSDFGTLAGRDMSLILSEDSRRPILLDGHADLSPDGLRLEAVLSSAGGCVLRTVTLSAKRIP